MEPEHGKRGATVRSYNGRDADDPAASAFSEAEAAYPRMVSEGGGGGTGGAAGESDTSAEAGAVRR